MFRLIILLCTLLAVPSALSAQDSLEVEARTEQLLRELDRCVGEKSDYHRRRAKQITDLKDDAGHAKGMTRVNLYQEIYELYAHFQTDSAQVYLNKLSALDETRRSPSLRAYVAIGQAEILAVAGLYAEAAESLAAARKLLIDPDDKELLLFYYRTQRTLYGWMADYTAMPGPYKEYTTRMSHYRDTLLMLEGKGYSRDIVLADKANAEGHPREALSILSPYKNEVRPDTPDPYICFTLYQAYRALGRRHESLYYLTLTAIADLQRGITEYQALPLLAQQLYLEGDLDRAYEYLVCSMEDAAYCKAMLRAVEVSKIFPIIDKQYKAQQAVSVRNRRVLLVILTLLLIVLSAGIFYLRKQMKRLHATRRQQRETNARLADTNRQLEQANARMQDALARLQLSDKVKVEYIARYLDRCRGYLDTMTGMQHSLARLFKERRMEELARQLKSNEWIHKEQERLYTDFDAAFLTLFPDFIEKFNALLKPEEQIIPRHEGRLNTELRIFALIRLGITDTPRIAHFLSSSTATVYSYRSKLRYKARGDHSLLEERVRNL